MAFFAIFALAASPSFAFGCCCRAAHASAQKSLPVVSTAHVSTAHVSAEMPSGCDDCDAPGATTGLPALPHPDLVAAPTTHQASGNTSQLQQRCDCAASDSPQIALTDAVSAPNFAALVGAMPPQIFSFPRAASASIRLAFASNAARPRSPSATPEAGRAPPVFGI